MSTYFIFERNAPILNLIKFQEDIDRLWSVFFDGSRNKNGASVMLVSPSLEKFYFYYRLQFSYTNNITESEALIQDLQLAQRRGIKSLKIFEDSELVHNQVRGHNITKNNILESYK